MVRKLFFVQSRGELGGAEFSLLTLLRHLDRAKLEPTVVMLGFGREPLGQRLEEIEVPVLELRRARLHNPLAVRRARRELAGLAIERGTHALIANGYHPQVYSAPAARACGARSVLFARDFPPRGLSADAVITRIALRLRADMVLTASGTMAECMRRRLGNVMTRIVPNSVEVALFEAADREHARRSLGLADRELVFVLPGRLQPGKGQDLFLRAAALVARELPMARFVVAGEDLFGRERRYAASLPVLAQVLGIGKSTAFPGNVPAPSLFSAADVIAVPSVWPEAFGRAVIEAGAAGKPVICSDHGGPAELTIDGETGVLVPPGNEHALAEAMIRLGHDHELRARLGTAGRRLVESRFGPEQSARSFERAMAELWDRASGETR